MTLRARLFIIISIVVLLILGISIFLMVYKKAPASVVGGGDTGTLSQNGGGTVADNGAQNGNNTTPTEGITTPVKVVDPVEIERNSVRQLSRIFVERYNTFSSDNNFQNIVEVQSLVTDAFWKKISGRVGTTPVAAKEFSSSVTQIFNVDLSVFTNDSATVALKGQREMTKGTVLTRLQQGYTVGLKKVNGEWLVDSFVIEKLPS